MDYSKPAGIGILACALAAGAFWIYSEHENALHWRQESDHQHSLAEAAIAQAASSGKSISELRGSLAQLRVELSQQHTQLEAIRAEIRDRVAAEPIRGGGFVPAVQAVAHGRAWGPEQALGEPDTPTDGGDHVTAWASKTADGQAEWLILEYAQAVAISKIRVYESFNPGALNKVSVFDDAGNEVEVWSGKDPTPVGAGAGVSELTLAQPRSSRLVKLYLDSMAVPGWNEIDAVGIVDEAGKTYWAVKASASSTYAEGPEVAEPAKPPAPPREPIEF